MTYGELLNWLKSKDEYSYILFNISSTARMYYAHLSRSETRKSFDKMIGMDGHDKKIVGKPSARIYGFAYTNDEEDRVHVGDLKEFILMMVNEHGKELLDSEVLVSLEDDDTKDYEPSKAVKVDEDLYVLKID